MIATLVFIANCQPGQFRPPPKIAEKMRRSNAPLMDYFMSTHVKSSGSTGQTL